MAPKALNIYSLTIHSKGLLTPGLEETSVVYVNEDAIRKAILNHGPILCLASK